MDNPQERSLAWLAGILDGEGSVSVQAVTRKQTGNIVLVPYVCITNSDEGILKEVRRILDELGLKHRSYSRDLKAGGFEGFKPCFNLRVDGQQPVADFILRVGPYLKSEKIERAANVMRFIESRQKRLLENRNALGHVRRATYTRAEIEFAAAARSHKRAKSSETLCQAPNVVG